MRRLNSRWLAGLTFTVLVTAVLAYLLHEYQMTRIASAFLREGRRAHDESRHADAIRYLRSYVSLAPNDSEGLILYSELLSIVGRLEPAYFTLEKVLRHDPEHAEAQRKLITLAMQLGRFAEARVNIEKLLKRSPDDADLCELKGKCQIAQTEFAAAKETLKAALTKNPQRLECYGILAALLYSKLKSPAEATTTIDQMVLNNPDNFLAYLNRGKWRMEVLKASSMLPEAQGEPLKAAPLARDKQLSAIKADAEHAIQLAPQSAHALEFASRAAIAAQTYPEARQYAQRGIEAHPADSRFYVVLADVEMACSHPNEALEYLKRAVKVAPQDRDLRWNLANRMIDVGQESEARTEMDKLKAERHPSELTAFLEARLLIRHSQWLEAISRLEGLRPRLTEWPKLAKQADILLAMAFRETDSGDQQLASYRRAVDADPLSIPARIGLAETLLSGNFVRQASEEYRRILKIPGAPPAVGIEFARSLYRLVGRQTAADQDWTEFDQVLTWVEQQAPQSAQVSILRAEKLVAQGRTDDANQLISTATSKTPKELDLWTVQITLAQIARNWEEVERLLQAAEKQFGPNVVLRIVRGRYLLQRHGAEASSYLKQVAQPHASWTEQELFAFHRNFTMMFLAVADYDEAERIGLLASKAHPGDLSIRLMLFDVALRAKRPKLMESVLTEVSAITGQGPLWHYGQAVYLTLQSNLVQDRKQLDEARIHLTKAKALRPAWTRIPLLSAEIETQRGDFYGTTEYLLEAISLGERNPSVLSRTVSLLFSQKRFIDADQVVRRLQERQNLFTGDMIRSASEISMRLNDATRALDLAEQLARNSDNTADKVWLATVLGTLGRHQEAEQQLRKVIEADPVSPESWIALVQTLSRAGQIEKAEQVISDAERAMAADQSALTVAQCYETLGKLDLAQSKYKAALEQAPTNMLVVRRVVEFQMRTGRSSESEPLLRSLLTNTNINSDLERRWATRNLALSLAINGNSESLKEGLVLIEGNLASGPAIPADERIKALILTRQPGAAQRRQAITLLEKLLVHETDTSVEDRFLLARLYLATGDRSKGRAEFRKVLASRSRDPRYISAYLQLMLQSGETSEAELWMAKLKEFAPDDLMTADFQAQLLFGKTRYEEAISFLKEVITKPPQGNDTPDSLLARQLWGARRLEDFARKLIQSKNTSAARRCQDESELLYQQYVHKRPKETLTLAEFYSHVDRIDQALQLLAEHSTEATTERIAAVSVGIMRNELATQTQLSKLQELLLQANAVKKHPVVLNLVLADLMSWRSDFDGAIQLYQQVIQIDPHNIAALNNLSMVLAMSGRDTKEPFRLIQKAMEFGGPKDVLLDTRGLAFLATGVPDKALTDFEESLKDSDSSERNFHVALACAQLNQSAAAKRAFSRAEELGLSDKMTHPLERPLLTKLRATLAK